MEYFDFDKCWMTEPKLQSGDSLHDDMKFGDSTFYQKY